MTLQKLMETLLAMLWAKDSWVLLMGFQTGSPESLQKRNLWQAFH